MILEFRENIGKWIAKKKYSISELGILDTDVLFKEDFREITNKDDYIICINRTFEEICYVKKSLLC